MFSFHVVWKCCFCGCVRVALCFLGFVVLFVKWFFTLMIFSGRLGVGHKHNFHDQTQGFHFGFSNLQKASKHFFGGSPMYQLNLYNKL